MWHREHRAQTCTCRSVAWRQQRGVIYLLSHRWSIHSVALMQSIVDVSHATPAKATDGRQSAHAPRLSHTTACNLTTVAVVCNGWSVSGLRMRASNEGGEGGGRGEMIAGGDVAVLVVVVGGVSHRVCSGLSLLRSNNRKPTGQSFSYFASQEGSRQYSMPLPD